MTTALRPLTLGELLDRTFQLYRNNFLLFVGIAATAYFPSDRRIWREAVSKKARMSSPTPIAGRIACNLYAASKRTDERLFFWIDDYSYVAWPNNQIADFRSKDSLEPLGASVKNTRWLVVIAEPGCFEQ